jgi:hypothetical protein
MGAEQKADFCRPAGRHKMPRVTRGQRRDEAWAMSHRIARGAGALIERMNFPGAYAEVVLR